MRARLLVYILLVFTPGLAQALGLGKLQLESALNEPFEGRIELFSATVPELDSLNIRLADPEAFDRAGIPRPIILQQLNFAVKETEGGDYIRVYSIEPIREPFLNFLLEVNWSNGRLFREYTILLDPPVYANEKTQKRLAAPPPEQRERITAPRRAPDRPEVREIEDNQVVYDLEYTPPAPEKRATVPAPSPAPARPVTPPSPPPTYTIGDEYGPVVRGDTLWSLAKNLRPDTSVSIQQMMFAILRANPEAFIDGNINGLRRGHVLQMPDIREMRTLDKAEAFNLAKNQNELWAEARSAVAEVAPQRPEGVAGQEPEAETAAVPPEQDTETEPVSTGRPVADEGRPELRLVTPGDGTGAGDGSGDETAKLNQELVLARESLEALTQENAELRDQISESDTIIEDMKRLIDLRENELAMLQEQVVAAAAEAEAQAAAEADARAAAEAETVAEAQSQQAVGTESGDSPDLAGTEPGEADELPAGETGGPGGQSAGEGPGAGSEPAIDEVSFLSSLIETTTGFLKNISVPEAFKDIPGMLGGFVETARSNLLYAGGAVGALLLLVLLSVVRRRRAAAPATAESSVSEEDFFSEDATDLGMDIEDSEARTAVPTDDEEAIDIELPAPEEETVGTDLDDTHAATFSGGTAREEASSEGAGIEDEDPMSDVNVYLAYEDFDQAEQVVKNAIAKEPDNLEFHAKLLEVYYAANNKKAYEEAAKVLHDKVGGKGDYWNMAQAMWKEISPNRELFAEPVKGEEQEAETTTGGGIVNIAGDEEEATAAPMDFDLDVTASGTEQDEEEDLDMSSDDEDILDVTAGTSGGTVGTAADTGEDEFLDVTSVSEEEQASDDVMDLTFASSSTTGEDDSNSLETDEGVFDVSGGNDEETLDISLDTSEAADKTTEVSSALDDGTLDFALDKTEVSDAESTALSEDISEGKEEFDFSLDESSKSGDIDHMDEDTVQMPRSKSSSSTGLSLDSDMQEEVSDAGQLEEDQPEESELEISLDSTRVKGTDKSDLDLLDSTSAVKYDKSEDIAGAAEEEPDTGEDMLDVSSGAHAGDDILDVSSTQHYELSDDDDLLDVSATSSAPSKESTAEETADDDDMSLDMSGSPDTDAGADGEELLLDESALLEESSEEKEYDFDIDSTMKVSKPDPDNISKQSVDTEAGEPEPDLQTLELDSGDDDQETLTVSSADDGEQDIASRLDLAKAYVELGDTENAKSILDEVISAGTDEQRQQAEELLGQI